MATELAEILEEVSIFITASAPSMRWWAPPVWLTIAVPLVEKLPDLIQDRSHGSTSHWILMFARHLLAR